MGRARLEAGPRDERLRVNNVAFESPENACRPSIPKLQASEVFITYYGIL